MDRKHIVRARLAAAGISLSEGELDQVTVAYARLQAWESVVQGMLQAESEPALIFHAQVEDES
jgi:hypothetical protein